MMIQMELWQLITLLLAFFACVGAFGKVLIGQIDQRFSSYEDLRREAQIRLERDLEKLERQLQQTSTALPVEYVRREDWIRFSSTMDAKLDMLHQKFDGFAYKALENRNVGS